MVASVLYGKVKHCIATMISVYIGYQESKCKFDFAGRLKYDCLLFFLKNNFVQRSHKTRRQVEAGKFQKRAYLV